MTAPPAFDRLLDRLQADQRKVVGRGDQRKASCPGPRHEHDDRNPSLAIRRIEGGLLLHCHAGCTHQEIATALGWSAGTLLHDDPSGVMIYRYDDGRRVRRSYDKIGRKHFRQFGNTDGQRTTLYHLSKIEEARAKTEPIILVESEKDVLALESIGAYATCAPMGASNFDKVDPEPLDGLQVIAIAHDDSSGEKWAQAVRATLDGKAMIDFAKAKVGNDAADHIAAGYGLGEFIPVEPPELPSDATRRIRLTPLSSIKPRPVRWAWVDRIPNGELTLTPGRGGVGKSTFHIWVIANLTRGTLPGVHFGQPKPCIIAASEDSYERTVVPRLIAAGADMELVYRADVVTETNDEMSISLPRDIEGLIVEINRAGVALLSLDPVMSLVFSELDTHKDREMRLALEPLAKLADRTGCAVLGNAHFNKSTGSDPMTLIMASAAFGNVARAALGFARDTEDGSCVISQIKNNLGRLDLPSLRYRIDSVTVDTEEGPADVGKLVMDGESKRSVADILRDRNTDDDDRSERDEAVTWLLDYLTSQGGSAKAGDAIKAAVEHGIAKATLTRARWRAKVGSAKSGMTGGWVWTLEESTEGTEESKNQTVNPSGSSVSSSGGAVDQPTEPLQSQDDSAGNGQRTCARAGKWEACDLDACALVFRACVLAETTP